MFFPSFFMLQFHNKCKPHSQYHCSVDFLVTLDLKTKSASFQQTYTSFFYLHNKSKSEMKFTIHPSRGRGRKSCWNSQNPTNNHNKKLG